MSAEPVLDHVERPAAGEPEGALVLLHGRGVDERDLAPLLNELDPERRFVGASVRAPLTLPPDPSGRHWYVVRRLGYPDRETFFATLDQLGRWLEWFLSNAGVPLGRTVVGGFSQGAVMSYALSLGADRPPPAAVMALSGFLPSVDGFELDLESRRGLPVVVAHGSLDPVISVEFGRQARERLEAAGLDVLYLESPVGHGIDPAWLDPLRDWLRAAVPERTG